MNAPIISDDPLYQLLRNDDVSAFNQAELRGRSVTLQAVISRA